MTSRNRFIAVAAAAAILIAFAWVFLERGASPTRSRSNSTTPSIGDAESNAKNTSQAMVTKVPPRSRVRAPTNPLPGSNVPLDEAVLLLRESAQFGDLGAQIELSRRLRICTKSALRSSSESDQRDLNSIEQDKTDERLDESSRSDRAANIQRRIDDRAHERQACDKVPLDIRATWIDWVDRAALSGDTEAMLEYAKLSTTDYDSVTAIVKDVDAAIEHRDKARAYLQEALQLGDQRALADLAYGYFETTGNTPSVFAPDAIQSYAYAYAGTLAGVSRPGDLEWVMSTSAESLDASQLAEAQAEGRLIYERCCKN